MGSMQGFQLVGQELQISVLPADTPLPLPALPAPQPPEKIDTHTDSDFGATGTATNPLHNRLELMKKLMTSHQLQGVPTVVGNAAPGQAAIPPPPSSPAPPSTTAAAA